MSAKQGGAYHKIYSVIFLGVDVYTFKTYSFLQVVRTFFLVCFMFVFKTKFESLLCFT